MPTNGTKPSDLAEYRTLADHPADTASNPVAGCGDRISRRQGALVEARMWDGLVGVAKETYTAALGEGVVPRPLMMPLVRGELVGMIWVRPLKVGQDALAGIAELANIAAAASADEVVLAWETHDVATACELPIVGPAPCLNMVLATRDGHVLHQFPLRRAAAVSQLRGLGVGRPPTGGRRPRRSAAANWCRRSRPR
ncbi:hypothetical protein GCM10020256_74790 [Streptomyces thermocoprophilus]